MHTKPKTINDALNQLSDDRLSEIERWIMLRIILRQFMLAEDVDLDRNIKDPE